MKKMVCFILFFGLLVSCGKPTSPVESVESTLATWQEQYDLGMRYLSEGNYQEAIIAFSAAIKIAPKEPNAYLKLAESYLAIGDDVNAKKTLEEGFFETQDSSIKDYLDGLQEPGAIVETENHTFYTEVVSDGWNVDAENLTVRVHSNRTATITIGGISIRDTYVRNLSSSDKDIAEYMWDVEIICPESKYSVSTATWAFDPGQNEAVSITDMQHSVWVWDDNLFHRIDGGVTMTYTSDSVTWTFSIPDEYPFDFANVERYEVRVQDVEGTNIRRVYSLNNQ